MLKHPVKYVDFDGNPREEVVYFNLTEAEVVALQAESDFGLQEQLQEAIDTQDIRKILEFIKTLVHSAYGEKSADGKHFRKNAQIREDFISSALYSDLLLGLFEEEGMAGVRFIQALLPQDLLARATSQVQGESTPSVISVQENIPEPKPDARQVFADAQAEKTATNLTNATPEQLARFREWQQAEEARKAASQ